MLLTLSALLLALSVADRQETAPVARPADLDWSFLDAPADGPVPPLAAVPAWAFDDPVRWDANQCGQEPDAACLRAARNRLALARVDRLQYQDRPSPAERVAAGESRETVVGQRCRWIATRSEEGVGGAVTRSCGDTEQAGEAHRRMMEFLRGD